MGCIWNKGQDKTWSFEPDLGTRLDQESEVHALIVPVNAHPERVASMSLSPEEELARLKSVRAAHRSSATKSMNEADGLLGTSPLDPDELTLMQTTLSAKFTTLETLNAQIVALTPEVNLEDEIRRADDYSEKIQRMLLLIRKALKPPPTPPRVPVLDPPRTHPPPGTGPGTAVADPKVRYPCLTSGGIPCTGLPSGIPMSLQCTLTVLYLM